MAKWDESKHPRNPAGSEEGGRFVSAARQAAGLEKNTRLNVFLDALDERDLRAVDDTTRRLITRSGKAPEGGPGSENELVLQTIRAGDLVDFGTMGKHFVQGWRDGYFFVTQKSSQRFVEDPWKWNLQGAIHFSNAKKVLRGGYQ